MGKLLRAGIVNTGAYLDFEGSARKLRITSLTTRTDTGEVLGRHEVVGDLDKFWDLEKKLVCDILRAVDRPCDRLPSEVADAVQKTHTRNFQAFDRYSRGLDLLDQGKFEQAREAFQAALELDPEFQLARNALLSVPVAAIALAALLTAAEGVAPSATAVAVSAGVPAAAAPAVVAQATAAAAPLIGTGTAVALGVAGVAVIVGGAVVATEVTKEEPTAAPTVTGPLTGTWTGGCDYQFFPDDPSPLPSTTCTFTFTHSTATNFTGTWSSGLGQSGTIAGTVGSPVTITSLQRTSPASATVQTGSGTLDQAVTPNTLSISASASFFIATLTKQ